MKRSFIILFCIVSVFFTIKAQPPNMDSLKNSLYTATNDSDRIVILLELGRLTSHNDIKESLNYSRQAFDLAYRNNYESLKANALLNIGDVYSKTGKNKLARNIFRQAEEIFLRNNDTFGLAFTNHHIGELYLKMNYFDSAATYIVRSLEYFEKINDTIGIRNTYINLGDLSLQLDKTENAIKYFKEALNYSEKGMENFSECLIYSKLSIAHELNGNYFIATDYINKAIKIAEEDDLRPLLSHLYLDAGNLYYNTKNYSNALYYYYKAKQQAELINNPIALIEAYIGLANVNRAKELYKSALGFLILASDLIDKYQANVNLPIKIEVYKNLAEIYYELGNPDIAYKYLTKKEILHDSLVLFENSQIAFELETKYHLKRNESEIRNLQQINIGTRQELEKTDTQKRKQSILLTIISILAFIALLSLFWIYRSLNKNKKLNYQLEQKNNFILLEQIRVKNIVNSLPEIFFETDNKGKIVYTNQNFYDKSGYTFEDFKKGLFYHQFIAGKDVKKVNLLLNALIDQQKQSSIEIEFIKKDGTSFPAIISLNLRSSENGYEFFGIIIDITEKKATEQNLMLLNTSVEQSNIAVVITDNDANIIYVNSAFERNSGYSFAEVKFKNPNILKSGLTNPEIYTDMWDTILTGGVWKGTFINKKKNGELIYEKTTITPLKDENGHISHFVANKEDVTSEVEKNEKIIKLFTATENSPSSVMLLDKEAKITYVNPAFEKITGYKQKEVIGSTPSLLNSDRHDDSFYDEIWKSIHNGELWQGILINKKKNGELYWDSSAVIPLRNEKEELIGYVCNDSDITEQIKTQEKLKNALDDLNEKSEEIYSSIKYAQRIQTALIPDESLVKENFSQSFVLFLPRNLVSGDFYWTHAYSNRKYIAAVDCTGHSVPGAFLSIIGLNLLDASIKEEQIETPAKILDFMGTRLKALFTKTQSRHQIQDDMEVSIAMVDEQNKTVHFASSRNRLYLVRDIFNTDIYEDFFDLLTVNSKKKMLKINGNRQFLGKKKDNFNYTNFIFCYKENDIFYLSSDGYFDQFGEKEDSKFKRKNFEELLLSVSTIPIEEQKEVLLYKLLKWKGETAQTDDITVIGVKL